MCGSQGVCACRFDGCKNPIKARGLCEAHYVQLWRSRWDESALKPCRTSRVVTTKCAFCGCEVRRYKSQLAEGQRVYCSREHFALGLSKFNVGPAHHNFKPGDGGRVNSHGYALVRWSTLPAEDRDRVYRNKSGWVFEHRVVMARILGRQIKSSERVHHINGIRDDNRPENLQLEVDHSSHSRLHAAVYAELHALRAENEALKAQLA